MKSAFMVSQHRLITLCVAIICLLLTALYGSLPIQITLGRIAKSIRSESRLGISRTSGKNAKLKVFMYELPRKYNFGLFNRDGPAQEIPWKNLSNLPGPHTQGLKKQHSVEYWMTLDLLDEGGREFRAAQRVSDPGEADVFFVPYFASLSFNVFGVSMRDPETEHDKKLQVGMIEYLSKSPWYQRSGGRDHVLVLHHPNAFRFLKDRLNLSLLVVADFGRFPKGVAALHKDVVAPYSHMVPTYNGDDGTDPFEERTTLLFFQGRVKRKDDGVVRTQLAAILENQPRVHFEEGIATNFTVEQAMQGMRSSRFCLHPAGDTPSSCRLFDAIVSHCVPVIVSDKIELPFEDELDYSEFSLFFSVDEAVRPGFLLGALEKFSKRRWMKMWRRLKQVTRHFEYQHPSQRDDAVNMLWSQIHKKVPAMKLAMHRAKRLKIQDWWKCKRL
ncbi:probable arabinosyltransferase ARAD1 [Selaginella moellendorffii]|nr:probable arabinosyltransferase ARAD1 [Selaginella moellendorffii]|eukprot:XP_024530912.1 probable arabinosyltransferase ARAD1 [Selaginella moellendorffii]